jgi:membrane protease YdiL (CAAX protease family)
MRLPSPHELGLIVLAIALAIGLWRQGILSRRSLARAPRRAGKLTGTDLLIAVFLMLFGGSLAPFLTDPLGLPADSPQWMLARMVALHLCWLPAIGYTFYRASQVVEGGVRGFGLRMQPVRRIITVSLVGALLVIPLALGTLQLFALVSSWIGYDLPANAHPSLVALAETPSGPVRWGLIVSAVIVAPFFEEIIFRGMAQTALLQGDLVVSRRATIAVAAGLFAVIHVGAAVVPKDSPALSTDAAEAVAYSASVEVGAAADGASDPAATNDADESSSEPSQAGAAEREYVFVWPILPALFVFALGLGYVYERTGSLWPAIFIHVLFNLLNVGVVVLLRQNG